MLKNISRLQHLVGDKVYHFMCDMDSPLNEVKNALQAFMQYVEAIEQKVKEAQEKSDEEKPQEEPASEQPKME